MENWYFPAFLALILAPVYIWGFMALPRERWQIICALPVSKLSSGGWQGLNLTYYGFFVSTALSSAMALVVILIGAAGVDFDIFAAIAATLMGICLPAARLIALWIEKKRYVFSIGAASFVGIVLGPWVIFLMETLSTELWSISFDPMTVMAALMIGYALGEGMGRLACISFGCCYGRPIEQMPKAIRHYFGWAAFTFKGSTKKIVYAHNLEGEKIFAVQAVTAVLYTAGALTGVMLYLTGRFAYAFLFCLMITQTWRFASEFLRYDYRGGRKISIYQLMSLAAIPYCVLISFLFSAHGAGSLPDLKKGLQLLWNPATIIFLQLLWAILFIYTGRSSVTGSELFFHVHKDRI